MNAMKEMATVGFPTISLGFPIGSKTDVNVTGMGVEISTVFVHGQWWICIKKNGRNNFMGKNGNLVYFTIMQNFNQGWETEAIALASPQWFRAINPGLLGV